MGKKITVFAVPEELEIPKMDFANFNQKEHNEKEEAFLEKLREMIKENSDCPYNGKIVRIPMADSYAQYMVSDMNEVVHLPLDDAWDSPQIDMMTMADVKANIDRQEKLAELFSKKS